MQNDPLWKTAVGFLPQLFNAALRLARDPSFAEDLVQETYRIALERQDQLRDTARLRPWLFRILRNLYLDSRRRDRSRPDLRVVGAEPEGDEEAIEAIDPPLLDSIDAIEIRRAVEALAEEFRTAVMLCDIEGFTYEEIAEVMECPIGTVRSRIARARAQLAVHLAEHAKRTGLVRKERKP